MDDGDKGDREREGGEGRGGDGRVAETAFCSRLGSRALAGFTVTQPQNGPVRYHVPRTEIERDRESLWVSPSAKDSIVPKRDTLCF